jgi:fatty acid desaturase
MGKGEGSKVDTSVPLSPENEWIDQFDAVAFKEDIQALGDKLASQQGEADLTHLNKIIGWSNACAFIGICTLWMSPNPITVICLSLWAFSRWTMIGHHVCHGGYDKVDPTSYFNRFTFAVGSQYKRTADWLDWMLPEAWNVEHNNLHHYSLGEPQNDPDLVEYNMSNIRNAPVPTPAKWVLVFILASTWKWYYYAPNTYKQLKLMQLKRHGVKVPQELYDSTFTLAEFIKPLRSLAFGKEALAFFDEGHLSCMEFFTKTLGPFFLVHFILLPLPIMFVLGKQCYWNAVCNLLLGEVLTNLHAFCVIANNHAGDDLYKFSSSCKPKSPAFYMRQVISSANFDTGGDVCDFMHGWLNYQVEHHLWPQLSMLSYQKAQPMVKEICAKHGLPYIQQNVFWRVKKTVDIMAGTASMRPFPEDPKYLVWNDLVKKAN